MHTCSTKKKELRLETEPRKAPTFAKSSRGSRPVEARKHATCDGSEHYYAEPGSTGRTGISLLRSELRTAARYSGRMTENQWVPHVAAATSRSSVSSWMHGLTEQLATQLELLYVWKNL